MRTGLSIRCLALAAWLIGAFAAAQPDLGASFNVRDYGAAGDGAAMDTAALQRAVDACAESGGGTVLVPPGRYRCGTLHLRGGVMLWLDHGATLLGSVSDRHYEPFEELPFPNDADPETSYFRHAMIFGEGLEHIAIGGTGAIDMNRSRRGGPKAIALRRCRFVDIRGVRILNAPNYAISLLGTDGVNIDGVSILNGFADGIDPDSCRDVRISNCRVVTVDDAIVPKASFSLGERRACERITVTNCVLSTVCNGFKLGTESGGGFRRIAVSNCVITGHPDNRPTLSGIAIESVDGGPLEDVVVSNITMVDVRAPIFIRLGNRGRDMDTPVAGTLRHVSISNVTATRASLACSITGIPGHAVEGVTLSNIRIDFAGGNPRLPEGGAVPELEAQYPEAPMFGPMPAYGLYIRHARDIVLRDVHFTCRDDFWRLTTDIYRDIAWPAEDGMPSHAEPAEAGHALVCDGVRGLRIGGFTARGSRDGAALLHFTDVRDARVCAAVAGENVPLLDKEGENNAGIRMVE